MASTNDNLLEKGYWEPAKQVARNPTLTRASEWIIDLLRPAVLTKPSERKAPIRRLAYLDGLRGFAAFLVYWQHHQLWSHHLEDVPVFENAYGYDGRYYFAALPGVRLLFAGGHMAVVTFFLISGYVLSAKPISLIQAGDYMKLGDNLSSALFRRWLRLHIPVIVTTFLYLLVIQLVCGSAFPEAKGSLSDELLNWWNELKNFTFVFRSGGEPWFSYNFHSWSIPVEFRGSIVVYTTHLAFSRCTRNARLWGQVGLILYFIYVCDGWFCAAFVLGMLLCDLDTLAADDNLPNFFKRLEPYKKPISYLLMVVSLWLAGVPAFNTDMTVLQRSPGWYYLSYLKPQAMWDYKWFFLLFASTSMMIAIPRIHWIKSFFETRFNLYLGRISFMLYLVHGPVLWTLGDRLYAATGYYREQHIYRIPAWVNILPMSKAGPLGLEPAFLVPHIILLPVTFWLAEVATKLIDEPSNNFVQWLYRKTLAPAIKL